MKHKRFGNKQKSQLSLDSWLYKHVTYVLS